MGVNFLRNCCWHMLYSASTSQLSYIWLECEFQTGSQSMVQTQPTRPTCLLSLVTVFNKKEANTLVYQLTTLLGFVESTQSCEESLVPSRYHSG